MAIDDNTLYGLTGAQVKELPEKIEAVKGKAKVLTTDDYNWPATGTKTSVALWLLEPGLYCSDGTADVRWTSASSAHQTAASPLYLVSAESYNEIHVIRINTADSAIFVVDSSTGVQRNQYNLITSIVDNLTSTSTTLALSANQGRVLKDMIDALPTGGVTELTAADYNYPTDNPTEIALWLLDEGVYVIPGDSGLRVNYGAGDGSGNNVSAAMFLVAPTRSNSNTKKVLALLNSYTSPRYYSYTNTTTGAGLTSYFPEVVQTTGTSTTDVMSQKAVTDTLFAKNNNSLIWIGPDNYQNKQSCNSTSGLVLGSGLTALNDNAFEFIAVSFLGNPTPARHVINLMGSGPLAIGGISIGKYSHAKGQSSIALGTGAATKGTTANSNNSVAIGANAYADGTCSVALGAGAYAYGVGVMDVGTSKISNTAGYNSSAYRLLRGLYDPQNAHDAATKGYVDTAVAGAGASAFTTNEWNALWA